MASKFNDIWTQKARTLGFPSRAVFKLLEANKKYNIIRSGSHVIDLGCAPGSWSKLASKMAGPKGFVLGMDLTQLTHNEQRDMGVDIADIGLPVVNKKTASSVRGRSRDKETDEVEANDYLQDGLLKTERKIIRSRSPVKFIQGDVTEWTPPREFRQGFDVVLSDMAPRTTGTPSHDSMISIDLCHSVLDLCAQVLKPPVTRTHTLTQSDWEKIKLEHEQAQLQKVTVNDMEETANAVRDLVGQQVKILAEKDEESGGLVDASMLRKAMRRNALRKDKVEAMKVSAEEDSQPNITRLTDEDMATYVSPVSVDGSSLVQIRDGVEHRTYYNGTLLMKAFQGENFPDLLKRVKSQFNIVHTFKPVSSRSESVEVFIYAKGYRGPFAFSRARPEDVVIEKKEDKAKESEVSGGGPAVRGVSMREVSVMMAHKIMIEAAKQASEQEGTQEEAGSKKGKKKVKRSEKKARKERSDGVVDADAVYNAVTGVTSNPNVAKPPKFGKELSIDEIYAQMGVEYEYTSDDMKIRDQLRMKYNEVIKETRIITNVNEAIHNASLGNDDTRRGVFDVKDSAMALAQRQNAYFNKTKKVDEAMYEEEQRRLAEEDEGDEKIQGKKKTTGRTVLVASNDPSPHSIYGSVALNSVPSPELLAQAMSMYWEEGLGYADKVKEEYGYKDADGFDNFDEED